MGKPYHPIDNPEGSLWVVELRTDDALHTFQVVADMAFATKREAQAYAVKREPCYRCRRVEYVPGRLGRFTDHTLRAMALEAYLNMKHHKNGEEP